MGLPISSCTCAMEQGRWGRAGWHFRLMRLGDLPSSMTETLTDEQIERVMDTYRGRWIAEERCPHYWKVATDAELY